MNCVLQNYKTPQKWKPPRISKQSWDLVCENPNLELEKLEFLDIKKCKTLSGFFSFLGYVSHSCVFDRLKGRLKEEEDEERLRWQGKMRLCRI